MVVLHSDATFGDSLVGYVVGTAVDASEVLESARAVLPAYMVPSKVLVLDELPLNASGKLDRKALPSPVFEAAEFRAPVTAVQEIVASVFGDVLGVERVGLDDDFFALGGNSLIATRLAARLGAGARCAGPGACAVRELDSGRFGGSSAKNCRLRCEDGAGSAGTSRTPPSVLGAAAYVVDQPDGSRFCGIQHSVGTAIDGGELGCRGFASVSSRRFDSTRVTPDQLPE